VLFRSTLEQEIAGEPYVTVVRAVGLRHNLLYRIEKPIGEGRMEVEEFNVGHAKRLVQRLIAMGGEQRICTRDVDSDE
jgi:hypothetical protein